MYEHSQNATVILVPLILLIAILFFPMQMPERIIIVLIVAFVFANFYQLTVRVDESQIHAIFGIGLFRKKFLLESIESVEQVKNKWWYGFGIRYTPHGWLYNVSGLDAVELRLKNGKKVRIGTDEPDVLVEYIQSRRV